MWRFRSDGFVWPSICADQHALPYRSLLTHCKETQPSIPANDRQHLDIRMKLDIRHTTRDHTALARLRISLSARLLRLFPLGRTGLIIRIP